MGISGDRDGDDSFDAFSQRDSMDLNSETSDTSAFTETARTSRGSDHLKHLLVQVRAVCSYDRMEKMCDRCLFFLLATSQVYQGIEAKDYEGKVQR